MVTKRLFPIKPSREEYADGEITSIVLNGHIVVAGIRYQCLNQDDHGDLYK